MAPKFGFETKNNTGSSCRRITEVAFSLFTNLFGPVPSTYKQDNAPIYAAINVWGWFVLQALKLFLRTIYIRIINHIRPYILSYIQ